MLWPGIGFARPSVPNLPMRGPRISAPGERRERALVVHDRRAGEVLHAVLEQPAVRRPDPVRDDRVGEREPDAEGEVDPELRALGHRAPHDRERDAGEHDLEQVAGAARDLREPVVRLLPDRRQLADRREEPGRADQRVAVAEREPEADRPVDERAEREDQHVLAGDVTGVLHPRQARLEEGEPRLHEHHQHRGDDDPDGRCGDQQVVVLRHRPPPPPVVVRSGCGRRSRPGSTRRGRHPTRCRCARRRRSPPTAPSTMSSETTNVEQRLRQEARLEHAPAVLVRDAALATVADRLDHRHADMPRRFLDRVDHRLDPLSQHDGLDLHHAFSSRFAHKKEASGTHERCARGLDASPNRRLRRSGRLRYYTK